MSRPLSPRAQEILAELEAEAQRRRPPVRETPRPAEARGAPDDDDARHATPGDPAGAVELIDAAAEECRRLQRRLAHVADALGEAAEQLRAAPAGAEAVRP